MERRDGSDTTENLYEFLDLRPETGLVAVDTPPERVYEAVLFAAAQSKLGIDAIFFYRPANSGTSIPYIFFRKLAAHDPRAVASEIAELHKLAWNMGRAPLLIVTLPTGQVLIYNNYIPPSAVEPGQPYQTGLIEALNIYADAEKTRRSLQAYHRRELESGHFWSANKARFDVKKRVDYTLLDNLKVMRRNLLQLLPRELDRAQASAIVHSLLGRAIFIKYLEDRKDTHGNNVFPVDFFAQFLPNATNFVDVLADHRATYELFDYLEQKFNGDIFPVSALEREQITPTHLEWLGAFLRGAEQLRTGQLNLWKFYTFDVIPITFISSIYEEFFYIQQEAMKDDSDDSNGNDDADNKATHYTPHHLVEFLADEVFPWEGHETNCKVLDPACGSGIFLVEIYRRLIERWRHTHKERNIDVEELESLLVHNIFGVDINVEAVRVAAFSLYLTLCDYLEPRYIWDRVKFPALKGTNLFPEDFFRFKGNENGYDLIIGNPPWQSELTVDAEQYRKTVQQNYPARQVAPDNQIALAFLWKSAELCAEDGEVCLLMPAKGLLFNRSGPHRAFRHDFFATYHVQTIVNFAALRHLLFSKGLGPAAALFFVPKQPDDTTPILYCCPKPAHSVKDRWQFLIEPYDIAQLPRTEARESDVIWKVAMWGGPRDYDLIKKLMADPYTTLERVCEDRGWIHGEGIIVGDKTRDASMYHGKPFVDVRSMGRFALNEAILKPFDLLNVQWPRHKTRAIFAGPHILIKQSPVAGERSLRAVLLKGDAIFTDSIAGIHGPDVDLDLLATCTFIFNSTVPLYHALMTSRKWLVERDELQKEEVMNLSLPSLGMGVITYENLCELAENPDWEEALRVLINQMYALSNEEQILIHDAIDYTLDYFRLKRRSNAAKPTIHQGDDSFITHYVETFVETLQNSFSRGFKAIIFQGKAPLRVVALQPAEKNYDIQQISVEKQQQKLDEVLWEIDSLLREQRSSGVLIQRIARLYIGNTIYIIKPDQRRYWTRSLALRDADEVYIDVMKARGVTT